MTTRILFAACATALFLVGAAGSAGASTLDWTNPPRGTDHVAEFRLWVPDDATFLRAVIVLVPGLNGDGRPLAEDADWQRLAHEQGVGLLGCSMRGQQGNWYYEAEHWSGAVLVSALDELAVRSGHAELASTRLAFWGHSAGGEFNYDFACWKPERVLAFVANKGAYYTDRPSEAARRLPGLWIAGQNDQDIRLQNITSIFAENRRQGARWCLAIEPNAAHEVGHTKELGIAFLAAVLRSIPVDGTPAALNPAAKGWIGDLTTHVIHPESEALPADRGKARLNSWLPDETMAQAWRAFVEGNFPDKKSSP